MATNGTLKLVQANKNQWLLARKVLTYGLEATIYQGCIAKKGKRYIWLVAGDMDSAGGTASTLRYAKQAARKALRRLEKGQS